MDLILIKLSLEKLHETVMQLQKENKRLKEDMAHLQSLYAKTEGEPQPIIQPKERLQSFLLDTKEVLKILGISYNTLQAIVRKGLISPIKIGERRVRFTRKEVRGYIDGLSEVG